MRGDTKMDYSEYVGLIVKVELINNTYFKGKCIDGDNSSIQIIDVNGQKVTLEKRSIMFVREVL